MTYPKVNLKVRSTKSNLSQYYKERKVYDVTIEFSFSAVLYIYGVTDMTAGSTVTAKTNCGGKNNLETRTQ